MKRSAARLTSALLCAGLAAAAAHAQPPRPRVLRADIAIVIDGSTAHVQEQFVFAGNPGALSFEALEQRCSIIDEIRIQSNGAAVPFARETTAPWLRLHDTSAVDPARTSLAYSVSYSVELREETVTIPVIMPLAVLRGSRRGDPVALLSVAPPAHVRVVLPRVVRQEDHTWSGRMAALPAGVRVAGIVPNASCVVAAAGSSGRFKLIFWLLVATFIVWVPAYMRWANRQQQGA